MKRKGIRSYYQRTMLPLTLLGDPDDFYNALATEGLVGINKYFEALWAVTCSSFSEHSNNHPFEVECELIVLNEDEENFNGIIFVKLPDITKKNNQNTAVFIAIYIDTQSPLRLFFGEADYHSLGNRFIFIIEQSIDLDNTNIIQNRRNIVFLHKDIFEECICDDHLEYIRMQGISPEKEYVSFCKYLCMICDDEHIVA